MFFHVVALVSRILFSRSFIWDDCYQSPQAALRLLGTALHTSKDLAVSPRMLPYELILADASAFLLGRLCSHLLACARRALPATCTNWIVVCSDFPHPYGRDRAAQRKYYSVFDKIGNTYRISKKKTVMKNVLLLKNNIVFVNFHIGSADYSGLILPISSVHAEETFMFLVPYNDSNTWEGESRSIDNLGFIPLTFTPLFEVLGIKHRKNIPSHIKHFHELQNWFLMTYDIPLVDMEKFDDRDGNVWIELSEKYLKFSKE